MALMPNVADGNANSYVEIVAKVKPFVNMVVMQIANYGAPNDVFSHYNDSNSIFEIASSVERTISALKVAAPDFKNIVDGFLAMVCNG